MDDNEARLYKLDPRKYATVVIPAAFTPRWLQICVSTLARYKNERDFNILVMDNSPEFPMIGAITETPLAEFVDLIMPTRMEERGHGLSLDLAIEYVNTKYFFATETDTVFLRDGWLDWFASFIKDEGVAMAGWLWSMGPNVDDGRKYISPAAALYDTEILKSMKRECQRNKSRMVCYGPKNSKRFMIREDFHNLIDKGFIGPFSDSRGFHTTYPIEGQWKNDWWWHEPGSWAYFRASCEWECVEVPGALIYNKNPPVADYTWYGSATDSYCKHRWAGTVSHNFDKHPVRTPWEIDCIEWWLRREYELWDLYVPEEVRQISMEKGLVKKFGEELSYALSRVQRG